MSEPFANIDATEQLSAYLDGELTSEERRAVESSLQGDASLRAELDALADARAFLAEHGAVSAPAGFLEDVLAAVDEEPEVVDLGWFQRMRRASRQTLGVPIEGIAVAAAALLVVWIALPGGSTPDTGAQQADRGKQAQGMGSSLPSKSADSLDNDAVTDAAIDAESAGSDAGEGAEAAVDTGLKQAKPAKVGLNKKEAGYAYDAGEVDDDKAMVGDLNTIGGVSDKVSKGSKGAGSGESVDGWADPSKKLVPETAPKEPLDAASKTGADGEDTEPEGTRFTRVPYSYQLTTDDPEVLYRLAAIAAKHRGEVTDTKAQSLEVTELTGSKGATVLVKIPSHALQDFGREIAALGLVTATNDNTMFAGDPVEVRVRVELASGAAEGEGTTPNATRKNRASEMDAYQEVEEAL